MQYERILVATGGSPWSDAAVAYAIALAAYMEAELCILTVLTIPTALAAPEVMGSSDLVLDIVEQQGHELLARAAEHAARAGVAAVTLEKWGNITETILQTALEENCALIVLGARGVSGWKRLQLGSISNAVAAKARQPVLIVKQPQMAVANTLPWRRVLVATGGSPWSDLAVDYTLALAQARRLEVCLLYVESKGGRRALPDTSEGKNILALAEARAAAAGVAYEARLTHGNVVTEILEMATSRQCDLIVLGSRGLTGLKRLMLGSISNAVAAKAPLPVLIVKRFLPF
jgi:nucleotide-binding universal stress UspA family protein